MSEMGQSLPKWALRATSAYPSTAAVWRTFRHFGFVPITEVAGYATLYDANSASNTFASFRSSVSKPSVNHP